MDGQDALRQLLEAVHGHNARYEERDGKRLAIAFPWMQPLQRDQHGRVLNIGNAGPVLRLFCPQDVLTTFLASDVPNRLFRRGMARASTILPVPNVVDAVRFVRNRRFEKYNRNGGYVRGLGRTRVQRYVAGDEFNIDTKSQSTGQTFFMTIQREKTDGPWAIGSVSSYGLCGSDTSLPSF